MGKRSRSQIVTHVERKSRYVLARKLDDRKADTFADQSTVLLNTVPAPLRSTPRQDGPRGHVVTLTI
jgi:IS30 family transposase